MGVMDFIRGQLIDVIEFKTDDKNILAHKFEDGGKQIMMGAKLTVRPGQMAVFVNEGDVADVFPEGMYELSTSNMPILTKLKSWKYGFESPFKVDIYFFSVDDKIQQAWGTPSKIAVKDEEFGIIRIGSNAYYSYKISDPSIVLNKLVGTDSEFTVSECKPQLNAFLTTSFTDFFAESKVSLYDAYANVKEFSDMVLEDVRGKFENYGLELITFSIRQISIPESVEEAMDSRATIGAMGGMDMYQRKAMTDAMAEATVAAAENEGSGNMAGMGMQLGAGATMGVGMAGMMKDVMSGLNPSQSNAQNTQATADSPSAGLAAGMAGAGAMMSANPSGLAPCTSCKVEIPTSSKFCPECGAKQEKPKFCTNCGNTLQDGVKFCPECGTKQI